MSYESAVLLYAEIFNKTVDSVLQFDHKEVMMFKKEMEDGS